MSAASIPMTPRTRGRKIGLILIIVAVTGVLWTVDIFLEHAQEAELASQARSVYQSGIRFLQAGNANSAVQDLSKAHVLERSNLGYELELVVALTAAGKTREAEPLANEVLDADRNNGAANLVIARLRLKEGKISDATAYYHRAIYGEWPQDAAGHRMAARLELIDLLVKENRKQDLLAELLPLEEEAGKNVQIQAQLSHLFMIAGAPSRAAEVYRELIREQPNHAAWYAGLGETDLEMGEYHAAHSEFAAASAKNPQSADIKTKLQLASTLAGLDPTPRSLPSAEKYQRSMRILGAAQEDLEKCIQNQPNGATKAQDDLLQQAEDEMEASPAAQHLNEASEQDLALAEKIWQARENTCVSSTSPDEESLRLILTKLAQ